MKKWKQRLKALDPVLVLSLLAGAGIAYATFKYLSAV